MGVKISALPPIVTPALTDIYAVVQSGLTYKETGTQLGTLFLIKANNLADVPSNSSARTNLGLAIGTNVQAYNAGLTLMDGATHALVNRGTSQTGTAASGATTVPLDNTKPQITEGNEYMSFAYTALNAANVVEVEVTAFFSGTAATFNIGSIFQDAGVDALSSAIIYNPAASEMVEMNFKYVGVVGTASATTFRFRLGPSSASTIHFNSDNGGGAYLNGLIGSRIDIKEFTP